MPRSRRRHLRRLGIAAIGLVVAATAAVVGIQVANADTNKSPERLVVYNNNIENMVRVEAPEDCEKADDFTKLISYMKKQDKSPDIFTVQQISNQKQLDKLVGMLNDALPGKYAGKIAIANPGSMLYDGKCSKYKKQQTNAVIYRTGRLTAHEVTTWRSDAPANGTGKCRNLDPSSGKSQDRVENIAVRLYDKEAKHYVNVASIHWPTKPYNGPDCADENMREANKALSNIGGAALKIMAGDTNATTPSKDWWQKARGYGFRDPFAEQCGGRVCGPEWDTLNKRRIDHILVDSGHGFSHVHNISWDMANGKYSHHRALTAYVKY